MQTVPFFLKGSMKKDGIELVVLEDCTTQASSGHVFAVQCGRMRAAHQCFVSVKTPAVKPCIVYIIVLLCSVGSKVPGA